MSNHPVIILEGPDGVGKTTLAKALCDTLGAHYSHATYRFKNKMFDYHTAVLFNALQKAKTQPVIVDRWWGSEVVYADVYRGGSKWPLARRMFEKAALRHGFIYVFCLPYDREAFVEHYHILKSKRSEMYDGSMEKVYDGYVKLYHRMLSRLGVTRYDFMKEGRRLNEAVQSIVELSIDYRAQQWTPGMRHDIMNFTGSVNEANFLFIGDQLKPKTRREVWPFFEYGNSSLWLAEAFEEAGVEEHELMFMNAYLKDGTEDPLVFDLINYIDLTRPDMPIIAMGSRAGHALNNPYIYQMKHPQWYRRFDPVEGKKLLNDNIKHLRRITS